MSKKDILDRISQQTRTTAVRTRQEDGSLTPEVRTQTTRVGAGVIRRRRKRNGAGEVALPPVSVGLPELKSSGDEATEEPEVLETEAPEVVEAEAAAEAAAVEEEPQEAVEEAAPETDEAPVEDVVSAEPVEAAPVEEEAAPVEEEAEVSEPQVVEAPPVEVAPEKPSTGLSSLPGLGSAVIKPPPGYDPKKPKAAQPAAKEGAGDQWREAEKKVGRTGREKEAEEEGLKGKPKPKRRVRRQAFMDDFRMNMPMRRKRNRRSGPKTPSPKPKAQKRKVQVNGTISVGEFSKQMGLKASEIIKSLLGMGVPATINEQLDFETVQLVAQEFEYEAVQVGFQEESHLIIVEEGAQEESGEGRPPVVTVMGHVDHGKTTLLDSIRQAEVAAGEAGGITQHIGAYQVSHNDELVTFIDTPGHEAFTAMRARGANVTDIVILVVAADDGVMPQTVESINHARAAEVPIVVAVNKCDKPGVSADAIRQRLMEHELVPEEYGGDTVMVNVSALKGEGIDDLLDAVMLVAELHEYQANPDRHAEGVVLEACLEKGRGPVATVLVKNGTLEVGQNLVLGSTYGRIRAMSDYSGNSIKQAGPSSPVEIIGLTAVPSAGDEFSVVSSEKDAKALGEHRAEAIRHGQITTRKRVSLEDLFAEQQEEEVVTLNLVVKGDVQGSVEALRSSFTSLEIPGADIKVLHSGVGGVTESDVTLASAYGAIVIGFNVRPDSKARVSAEKAGVEIRGYKVIYEALDEVKLAAQGLLAPEFKEQHQASVEIRVIFTVPKLGAVAGCMVIDGKVVRGHEARLVRDGVVVWEGKLSSLRRFKDDVREVEKGYECGIGLENFHDIKEGDTLETYSLVEVARAL